MSLPAEEARGQGSSHERPWEGGDLIVSYLEQIGVEYVFGVPGGAIEPLYDALARSERRGGIRPVVARHETDAAYMAEGYARQTGRLGVCCATTGPGATNMLTGVACAYANNIPILALTAQTALSTFGRGALQESSCTGINTVGMYTHCTGYNSLVSHPTQLEHKLVSAVATAMTPPMRPSHLSLPLDLMRSDAFPREPSYDLRELVERRAPVDNTTVRRLEKRLAEARRPVFILGDDCRDAAGSILDLAMLLDAPVVTTPHGKGLVSPWHPLFYGVVGFAGHDSANKVLADPEVDLVVAIGTALTEWASNGWDHEIILTRRLVHVEPTPSNFHSSPMASLHVIGSLREIFGTLGRHFRQPQRRARRDQYRRLAGDNLKAARRNFELEDEEAYLSDASPITPQRLMRELGRLFPPTTKYFADSGNAMVWGTHYLHPFDRRVAGERGEGSGMFRACMEFAPMAWAISAALGTAFGYRGSPVVCITGDGSVLMAGQELTVAVQHQLPVVFVILNDAALGMVKHGQRLGGGEPVGYQITPVDFAAVAEAMGAAGYRIESPADMEALDIDAITSRDGPAVLDVRIDGEQTPPMGTRMKVLGEGKKVS